MSSINQSGFNPVQRGQTPDTGEQGRTGDPPPPQLSDKAKAELESSLAGLPRLLQDPARVWLDTGDPPDEITASGLVSAFLRSGLHQLAIEAANIAGPEQLRVEAAIDPYSLQCMRACRSLNSLYVKGSDPSDRLARFLETDNSFSSLELNVSSPEAMAPLLNALKLNAGVRHLTINRGMGLEEFKALGASLSANCKFESLLLNAWSGGMGDAELEVMISAIGQNPALTKLRLAVKTDVAPLALALQGRSMHCLVLHGDPEHLIPMVHTLREGYLRVEELSLQAGDWVVKGGDYSKFLPDLCALIKLNPDVKVLWVGLATLEGYVDGLSDAITCTTLHELHLQVDERKETDCGMLLDGLRRNFNLRAFTFVGATKAQRDEIRQLMRANARMPEAARIAVGHAFAKAMRVPADAGAVMASHLTPSEARVLAEVNRGTSQASMQGRLLDLVRLGDAKGIAALCQRWADMKISLAPSVLRSVFSEARWWWRQQGDQAKAASMARAMLQAIMHLQPNGGQRYVPSKEELARLAQLAAEANDQDLLALVEDLFTWTDT